MIHREREKKKEKQTWRFKEWTEFIKISTTLNFQFKESLKHYQHPLKNHKQSILDIHSYQFCIQDSRGFTLKLAHRMHIYL